MKNIQIGVIVVGTILVSIPFITKMVEEYNYVRELKKIKEYVTQISDSKKQCTIEFENNVIESDCAEELELSDHIVIQPFTLTYMNGIFEGEAVTLISSKKYPQQYCMGFSGITTAIGDSECNNIGN